MDNTEPYTAVPSYPSPSTITSGVTGQSYSRDATYMVHNVVQQLQYIVKDNQELKESIRLNNEDLQKKYQELNDWKENMKREKQLLRQNFDKARSVVMELRDQNAFLLAKNAKLELRQNNCESDCSDPENQTVSSQLQAKYLAAVENLERQLKEALSCKEKAEALHKEVEVANQTLQNTVYNDQKRLSELNHLQEQYQLLNNSCHALNNQLRLSREMKLNDEKKHKEVKAQLLQLLEDEKAYSRETEILNSEKQHLQRKYEESQSLVMQLQDSLKKSKQEKQHLQYEKSRETKILENKIEEKDQSLTELFHEYDKVRGDNEKFRADCTKLQSDMDNLYARLLSAEESLARKDRELKDLDDRSKNILREKDGEVRKLREDSNFFKAQADVYKQDFLIEREDRAKTHEENERLRNRLEQLGAGQPVFR